MRNELIQFLLDKKGAPGFDRLVFITADLGFSVVEPLQALLGPRFINTGVAEALTATMAASIALEGYKVYIYSIVPFITFRCLEQIRNDICYHKADVTVVGVGAGFGYGTLGPTHHSVEDLAALAALPNMRVFNPGDLHEAAWSFNQTWDTGGPAYLRLNKGGDKAIPLLPGTRPDQVWEVVKGRDVALIVTGTVLPEALAAVKSSPAFAGRVQLLSVPSMKPFPSAQLAKLVTADHVVAISEVSPYGGLGGRVASALVGSSLKSLHAFEARDEFATVPASPESLRRSHGVDAASIANFLAQCLTPALSVANQ